MVTGGGGGGGGVMHGEMVVQVWCALGVLCYCSVGSWLVW